MSTTAHVAAHPPTINSRLLRLRDAAKYLSVSTKALRKLVIRGELPHIQLGRGNSPFLIDTRDLDRFVESQKTRN
jgi:excisionase family DNA binding protein